MGNGPESSLADESVAPSVSTTISPLKSDVRESSRDVLMTASSSRAGLAPGAI